MKYNQKSRRREVLLKLAKTIRLPKDYPWKVLTFLMRDLEVFLNASDKTRLLSIIRERNVREYMVLVEEWGLQSMNLIDALDPSWVAKYQLSSLLKKYPFKDFQDEAQETALTKFKAAEEQCKHFNLTGYYALCNFQSSDLLGVFTYAKSFIKRVLGDLTDADLNDQARHGPGATVDTERGRVSRYFKFENWPYSCSTRAFGKAVSVICSDERWRGALEDDYRRKFDLPKTVILNWRTFWHSVLKIDDTNKVTFVPKTALTKRTIAIESTMNLYLQLGVDGHIRKRLKPFGIDLDTQEKNQRLARLGSRTNSYATIDLSAASDTVSLGIVKYLFPGEWYDLLVDLRAHNGRFVNEDLIKYQKISSMGNGYTFAVESLIFASLVFGIYKTLYGTYDANHIAVFGDDIVVPWSFVPLLQKALTCSGFRINSEKSFIFGPVRESCGKDYFLGTEVRPVFLTEYPCDLKGIFNDLNRLKRILSLRFGIENGFTENALRKFIPLEYQRFVGPYSDEEFDTYIHSNVLPSVTYSNSTYKFSRLIYTGKDEVKCDSFHFRKLMHSLRNCETDSGSRFSVLKRNARGLRLIPSETSEWSSEYANIYSQRKFKRKLNAAY